jgi:hypothetical protein
MKEMYMSVQQEKQQNRSRFFLVEVVSEGDSQVEAPIFTQYGISPVNAMMSLEVYAAPDAEVAMIVTELTGEKLGEFLDEFIDDDEKAFMGGRAFLATQKSYENDGIALEPEEALPSIEDDFNFLDEAGDDSDGDDNDDDAGSNQYALPR